MTRRKRALLNRAVTLQFSPVPPDAVGETDVEAKWVQVAYEGQFLGYKDGQQPFAFTRRHFEEAVANLRSNPSYKAGPDGRGSSAVIPWDFNHASEMDPTSGALPITGAPSQGWTLDLEVRDGADGRAQLWALTSFYEPARGYVRNGQYAWASVSAIFDATHQVTGQNVGMVITSIALTNTPFLEGMERLAANRLGASRYFFAEPAEDAEDAFKQLRSMFGLAETADVAVVMNEVAKIAQWVASGGAPLGVDIEGLIGDMRLILALPALTEASAVLDTAGQIVQRLIEEEALGNAPAAPAPGSTEDGQMLKKLAQMLGVTESETSVEGAVAQLASLRDGLVKALKLDRSTASGVVLEAVEKVAENADAARSKLTSLLKALGVEDTDGAVDKIATLITQASELTQVMPELEGLRARQKEANEALEEAEVAEAMASYNLPDGVKEALLLQRRTSPEKFAEKFPKKASEKRSISRGADPKTLTSRVVSGPAAEPVAPTGAEINLDEYDGRNPTEKAMTYLAMQHEGWDRLSWDAKFKAAVALKRRAGVTFTASPVVNN